MKVLNKIKKVIIIILVAIFFIIAFGITVLLLNYNNYGVTELGDKTLVLIKEDITSENYKKGDLVIVKKVPYDSLKNGDEIFTYSVNSKGQANVEVGIVGDIIPKEKAVSFVNGASFSEEYIIGTSIKVYENLGSVLALIESKWGFLFMILVPGFIIFIYEIYALVVEIKYGKEEE